ncbi:hypothetical protein [Quadrisphaera sp. KR29]|uniref:hypothetical protein n=1 Tax=Quadrisphaera sp. KR29 TaxID=3461391 RepID=UPI004043BFE2
MSEASGEPVREGVDRSHDDLPGAPDPELQVLEEDETVPPRPEEDVADALRAEPSDPTDPR